MITFLTLWLFASLLLTATWATAGAAIKRRHADEYKFMMAPIVEHEDRP